MHGHASKQHASLIQVDKQITSLVLLANTCRHKFSDYIAGKVQ